MNNMQEWKINVDERLSLAELHKNLKTSERKTTKKSTSFCRVCVIDIVSENFKA